MEPAGGGSDGHMHLTAANLAHFLMGQGLLDASEIVAGQVVVVECQPAQPQLQGHPQRRRGPVRQADARHADGRHGHAQARGRLL